MILRFDYRDEAGFLDKRRIARQRWALASMQLQLGSPQPMAITARHLAKRAPFEVF